MNGNTTTSTRKASKLKMLRIASCLKQQELADMSGIPQAAISYWELHGVEKASCGRVKKVADALGCTVDDLLEQDSTEPVERTNNG